MLFLCVAQVLMRYYAIGYDTFSNCTSLQYFGFQLYFIKLPTAVTMIDHLLCHSSVNTDVLTGDKSGHVGAQIQYHICNLVRITNPAHGLLKSVRSLINSIVIVYPSGGHRVHTYLSGKAHRERVSIAPTSAIPTLHDVLDELRQELGS